MPKVVDHDQRRVEVVDALLDFIAHEGYAAVTSRSFARHLGVSNGTLWRYFSDKDDLLTTAYKAVVDQTNQRAEDATSGLRGLAAVDALLSVLLPLDDVAKREARVVVSFWGAMVSEANASDGRPRAELTDWQHRLEAMLDEGVRLGELRPDTPVSLVASMLISYTISAQLEYLFAGDEGAEVMATTVREIVGIFRAPAED